METPTAYKELKANWKNELHVKTYTAEEVRKHSTKGDLWIIIHGKVYDITEYARDHPGGAEPLIEVGGADATSAYEDVGHSEDAREIMHTYLVGVLEGAHDEATAAAAAAASAKKSAVSSIKVVRKPSGGAEENAPPKKMGHRVEIIALTLGAATLAWAANGSSSFRSGTSREMQSPTTGSSSFIQGFLVALSVCGIAGIFGARYFQEAASFKQGYDSFDSLPAYKQSSSPRIADFHPAGVLNPANYQKLTLRSKEELSDGVFRFVFNLPTKYSVLGLPIGQHVAIRGIIKDHTVVRSYTPVSNNRDLGRLELLIRVYPDGQLGNYLKALDVGAAVDIRGPKGAMRYRKGMSTEIGMVAGGTGITPLFQIIRAVCEDKTDDTKITLIYGNRSETDIMLRERLDRFAATAGHKFSVHYLVDQPSASWKGEKGRVNKDLLAKLMPAPSQDCKMLLCGPPGMVNAVKQSLIELGFEKPGTVSKMADQVFCF